MATTLDTPSQEASYRALHQAVLAIAESAPAGPDTIGALLKQIAESAVAALGAREARMVLVEHPAWRDLVPGQGPADGQVVLNVLGQLERRPILPAFPASAVLATGEALYVPDLAQEHRFNPQSSRYKRGIRAFAVVPLRAGGRVLGTLAVDFARPGELPPADREVLELFAAHAAAALERAQLIHDALNRARRDEAERQARAAAEAMLRARDEFLSVAAHELRTPLTALRGFVQVLLRQFRQDTFDPTQAQYALAIIDQQSQKLARLMTQLLDVSRLDNGHLALDPALVDLTTLVEDAVRTARLSADRHTFTVRTPGRALLFDADPLRLEQVLINLLDNAVKYSPKGGEVVVSLEVTAPRAGRDTGTVDIASAPAARDAGPEHAGHNGPAADGAGDEDPYTIRLIVQDHGIGVRPEHRDRIFERYYRAVPAAEVRGAGLGLYICRQIVNLHGGRIVAEFPAGGGTRMVVSLPDSVPKR